MVKRRTKRISMKEALRKRVEEGYKRRESFRRGIFREDLPEGVKFWKCGEGEHLIDIIPYIAGPNDPFTPQGEPTHVLELRVHQSVGAGEQDFVCLAENWNKPCPICEHRKQLREEGADDDVWKALIPKRRVVYNIVCYDSPEEEDKGIQVWEVAWWFAERFFLELAKGPSVGRHRRGTSELGFIPFADPDEGMSIAFTRQGSGVRNTQFLGHRFVQRDYSIPDELLDAAWVLDELIYIPTYDEVYEAYWGEGSVSEEKEPEEEEVEEVEEEEPTPTPRRKVFVGGRVRSALAETEAEVEEDEEEEEEPEERPTRGRRGVRRESEPEEEEPEEREVGENKCPGGGEFGVDVDQLDYCEECDRWEECVEEFERRERERQKKKARKTARRRLRG